MYMTTTNSLPPELILNIFPHITDRSTLLTCSLVARFWCIHTRPLLFRVTSIDGQRSRRLFSSLLSPTATFLPYVRVLSLSAGYPEDQHLNEYLAVLEYLEHVTTLGIAIFHFTSSYSKYQSSFSQITTLSLSAQFDTSTQCIDFLGNFISLQVLSLAGVIIHAGSRDEPYVRESRISPHLKQFELSGSEAQSYRYLVEWLLRGNVSLQTLGLYLTWSPESEDWLFPLLSASNQTLKTLKLDMTLCFPGFPPASLFGLNEKPVLQDLELTGIAAEWGSEGGIGFVHDLLSTSNDCPIQRITIRFTTLGNILSALKRVDWVHLAPVLQASALSNLQTLNIQYDGAMTNYEAKFFRAIVTEKLPLLVERGVLMFSGTY